VAEGALSVGALLHTLRSMTGQTPKPPRLRSPCGTTAQRRYRWKSQRWI